MVDLEANLIISRALLEFFLFTITRIPTDTRGVVYPGDGHAFSARYTRHNRHSSCLPVLRQNRARSRSPGTPDN
jgi:hypothetical protein